MSQIYLGMLLIFLTGVCVVGVGVGEKGQHMLALGKKNLYFTNLRNTDFGGA